MKSFYLFYIISLFTGNPFLAIAAVLIIYVLIDRYYLGFLSGITGSFKKSSQIRISLGELNINPQNARAAYSLGVLYFERKRFKDALKYFEHPRLKDDGTAGYLDYLGMTLMELGRVEEGKNYILSALELDPRAGYGLPYIYLIEDELIRGSSDKHKINDLEQKIQRFSNTENLYKMGIVFKKFGNREKAVMFFSRALAEYSYCPRGIKRLHRKWAILARIQKALLM